MYRTVWQCGAVAASAAGALAWLTETSAAGALILLVLALVVAAFVGLLQRADTGPTIGQLLSTAFVRGTGTWGCLGLMTWGEGLGIAFVALLLVLSPRVVDAALRGEPSRAREEPAPETRRRSELLPSRTPPPPPAPPHRREHATPSDPAGAPWLTSPVEQLDDEALCFAWRISYVALQQRMPPHQTLFVVQRRQEILDDLERRNASGLAAWFASGARAAGDPTKYVAAGPGRGRPTARQE